MVQGSPEHRDGSRQATLLPMPCEIKSAIGMSYLLLRAIRAVVGGVAIKRECVSSVKTNIPAPSGELTL